jgi:hypothetical protein
MNKVVCLLLLVAPDLASCAPECTATQARCNGTRVEVCDADGEWQQVMDCAAVTGPDDVGWDCCLAPESEGEPLPACLPSTECRGGIR